MPTVARAVLEVFHHAGVRTAFGLPGVHNLSLWREAGAGTPELVLVRHEQTTVYAADGLARATGGLGVALTTTGPGAANAVAAFGEAAASGSPVVLVASEISTKLARPGVVRGALHESRDQAALFEPLAKAVLRPRTAEDAVRCVAEAVAVAMTWPRGPVYVDIPTDVLDAQVTHTPGPATPVRRAPDPTQLDRAVAAIEARPRIVIWAGGGVVQADASAELAALAERLGAPVVTTFAARGVLPPEHRWLVGLPPHEPEVAAYVEGADLLLAVGAAFDGQMTRNWSMPRPPALVSINVDESDLVTNYEPDVGLVGDARLVLAELLERLPARRSDVSALDAVRSSTWARLRDDAAGGPALAFLDAVDTAVAAADATVVVDMAIPGYWYGGYGRVTGPRRLQYPIGWGTLGYALPAAVGAGAARTRPVLAVCGDGGFLYAVGELAVLRQENLPVTVLVVDDGGYGMLRYDQDRAGDPHRGVDLVRPDFGALARSFGLPVVTLEGVEGLDAALAEGLASGEPRMVVLDLALTPPRTTSPRWHD
ncbi:MAG TPA: thiamine pyrophosphate-binding protein [Nocardioides sp.]|uniref:thiamine pyrophosphate-binding protein n=1 Tax=Nocardioides sp. TaxID=35761 RepID=UPI002F419445